MMPSRINRIFTSNSLQTQVLEFYAFNGLFVYSDANIILSDLILVRHIFCVPESAFLIPIFMIFKHHQNVPGRSTEQNKV